jgi:hypothetical protein
MLDFMKGLPKKTCQEMPMKRTSRIFIVPIVLLISSFAFAQFSGLSDPNRPSEWVPVLGTGTVQYLRSVSCGYEKCRNYLNDVSRKIVSRLNQELKDQRYPKGSYQAVIRLKLTKRGDVRSNTPPCTLLNMQPAPTSPYFPQCVDAVKKQYAKDPCLNPNAKVACETLHIQQAQCVYDY